MLKKHFLKTIAIYSLVSSMIFTSIPVYAIENVPSGIAVEQEQKTSSTDETGDSETTKDEDCLEEAIIKAEENDELTNDSESTEEINEADEQLLGQSLDDEDTLEEIPVEMDDIEVTAELEALLNAASQSDTYIELPSGSSLSEYVNTAILHANNKAEKIGKDVHFTYYEGSGYSSDAKVNIKYIKWADTPTVQSYNIVFDGKNCRAVGFLDDISKGLVYTDPDTGYKLYMTIVPSSQSVKSDGQSPNKEWWLDLDTLYIKSDRASLRFKNGDASNIFNDYNFSNVTAIDMLEKIDLSTATTVEGMFNNCYSLGEINIPSTWDTSKVENFSKMFMNAGSAKSSSIGSGKNYASNLRINGLQYLDTSKCKDFSKMFYNTSSVSLDVTSFNAEAALDTSYMFSNMVDLKVLNLFNRTTQKKFNPILVENMSGMFKNCANLSVIDLGGMTLANKSVKISELMDMNEGGVLKAICAFPVEINNKVRLPYEYVDVYGTKYRYIGSNGVNTSETDNDDNRIAPLANNTTHGQGWIGFNSIKIYFDGVHDDGQSMEEQLMIDGATVNLIPNEFTNRGHAFLGWSTSSTATKPQYVDTGVVNFATNTRLYTVWERTTYDLTFHHLWDANMDGEDDTTVIEFEVGKGLNEEQIPESVKDNYGVKWYTQPDGKGTQIKPGEKLPYTKNGDAYAYYVAKFYDIEFNANGGTGSMDNQHFILGKAQYLTKNTFTREGYTFAGWSTRNSTSYDKVEFYDGQKVYDLIDKENSNIKLYAIWVKNDTRNLYHISYDLDGGECDGGNPAVYLSTRTDKIVLNNPVKNDEEFIGWTGTDINELTTEVTITPSVAKDLQYKAHFSNEMYTVEFYNEDNELIHSEQVRYGLPVHEYKDYVLDDTSKLECWITEDNIEYNFNSPIVSNLKLIMSLSKVDTRGGYDSEIIIKDNKINMIKGQSYKLSIAEGAWTSSDKKVVSIDKKGTMKALKVGDATVTNGKDRYTISVVQPYMSEKTVTLCVGESTKLKLENVPKEYKVSWSSSNDDKVQVINGKVYAVATGSATIYAYVNGIKYQTKVNVIVSRALPKTYTPDQTLTLYLGQSSIVKYSDKQFDIQRAKVEMTGTMTKERPDGAKSYIYKNEFVTFDTNTNKITARNVGDTTIKLTYKDITKTITVNTVTKVNHKDVYLTVGKSYTISTAGINSSKVTWTECTDIPNMISDIAVNEQLYLASNTDTPDGNAGNNVLNSMSAVSINKNKIKGVAVGDTTIVGDYKGNRYEFRVHVTSPEITTDEYLNNVYNKKGAIVANKYTLNLGTGTAYAILPTYTEQNLTWKSSKASVATVDNYGIIRTKSKGKCNITTKINGKSVTIALVVTDDGVKVVDSNDFSYKKIKMADGQLTAYITKSGRHFVSKN